MSLRDGAIETMAHRLYTSKWGPSMSGARPTTQEFHAAADALDALLDYLEEHASGTHEVDSVLAALREDTE